MSIFFNFFYVWLLLAIVAVILIFFRKDEHSKEVFLDIQIMLSKYNIFYGFFSMMILYLVFPFTIPYSIFYLYNKRK